MVQYYDSLETEKVPTVVKKKKNGTETANYWKLQVLNTHTSIQEKENRIFNLCYVKKSL